METHKGKKKALLLNSGLVGADYNSRKKNVLSYIKFLILHINYYFCKSIVTKGQIVLFHTNLYKIK